jgi:hypothetical protein
MRKKIDDVSTISFPYLFVRFGLKWPDKKQMFTDFLAYFKKLPKTDQR